MEDDDHSPLLFGEFDLADSVRRWLRRCATTHAPYQARLIERVAAHLTTVRPRALVLDQDATPLARVAVAIARGLGTRSFVVQHGAPYSRFGFAPLAADRLLAWGETSHRRFQDWGIPADRIAVTGSPRHDVPLHGGRSTCAVQRERQRIVLLGTLPPADDRPDLVAFHLNGTSYRQMLRMAGAALARRPGMELIVKLHPRCERDELFRSVLAEFPNLSSRIVRGDAQQDVLAGASCALSCGSSAGVEAALRGVPAIELLPAGSTELLPPVAWGFVGAARDEEQLDALLDVALALPRGAVRPCPRVFGNLESTAARQIVNEVLAKTKGSSVTDKKDPDGTLRNWTLTGSSSLFRATPDSPIDPSAATDYAADGARNREEEPVPSQWCALDALPEVCITQVQEMTDSRRIAASYVAHDDGGGPA